MDEEEDEDMVVVEEDHLFVLIVEKWAMCHDFVPNHMLSMGTITSTEHVTKYCPDLLEKWEEKKAHLQYGDCGVVENRRQEEEVDVWVVTQGGIQMGMDLENGEILGQNIEGKIRKVT
jgi:hypothetical protein